MKVLMSFAGKYILLHVTYVLIDFVACDICLDGFTVRSFGV